MEPKHFQHWPKHLPRHLTVPSTTLHFNLDVSSQRYGDKPAVIFYDSQLSYRELHRQVDLLAGFLQNRCGVRKGDRVILQMQNSPQFIIAYYAILRADAAVLPVSPLRRFERIISKTPVRPSRWSPRICMHRSNRCWVNRPSMPSSQPIPIT